MGFSNFGKKGSPAIFFTTSWSLNFKQSMTERIEVLERKLKIQRPRSSKENRWASFLAEIGKSHNS